MSLPTELRGSWVSHDAISSYKDRLRMLEKTAQARLNTIFLAMPPIGNNYGEGVMTDFVAFLHEAKIKGFVVFGWISNFKRKFPDLVDMRLPEEQAAQARWVEDIIVGFPCLDGIAIDYIRYPTWEVSDKSKQEGVSLTVKAIREVTDRAGVALLSTCFPAATITYRGVQPSWQGEVPAWFQDWFELYPSNYFVVEAKKGGTGLVNKMNLKEPQPDYLLGPSFMSYQQDPGTWLGNNFIDHLVPMQYTSDPVVMRNDVDLWDTFTTYVGRPMDVINLGLGWFNEPSSFPDSRLDPAAMVKHIEYGRSKGVGGYTIFRLGVPGVDDMPLIDALTEPNSYNNMTPPNPTESKSPFVNFGLVCSTTIPEFKSAVGRASSNSGSFIISSMVLAYLLQVILR